MDSAEESGCGGDKVIKDDDDSLIERCWEEQYRGDSRKWLIRDGSYRKAREPFCSTTQATYNFPVDEKDESSRKEKRRTELVRKFYEEAREELMLEYKQPPVTVERNSEYDDKYQIPGFNIEEKLRKSRPDLYEKYPLYSPSTVSFYSFNVMKRDPFRKNASFSKPLAERYEIVDM